MSSQFNLFPKGNKSGDCSDIIKLKKPNILIFLMDETEYQELEFVIKVL